MYIPKHLARAAAIGLALAAVAREADRELLGPNPPSGGEIFRSYVAIGNSITAGFQSNGINDSTQRQSYALLLARAMGTRYAYPALAKPRSEERRVGKECRSRWSP